MWHLLHVDKGNGGDPKEKLEVWERAKGGIALYDETPRSQWKKAGEVRVVVVVVADGAVEHQRRRKESSFPWKTGAFVKRVTAKHWRRHCRPSLPVPSTTTKTTIVVAGAEFGGGGGVPVGAAEERIHRRPGRA